MNKKELAECTKRRVTKAEYKAAMQWFKEKYPERELHSYKLRPEEYFYYNAPHSIEVFSYDWSELYYFIYEPFYSEYQSDLKANNQTPTK